MTACGLAAVLVVVSAPAAAAWSPLGEAESGMTHYFDPATVTASGDLRSVQHLASQAKGPLVDEMSNQTQWQVDCRLAQGRIVQMWWFQQAMAQGLSLDVTFRTDTQWHPVVPGSQTHTVMAVVCGR